METNSAGEILSSGQVDPPVIDFNPTFEVNATSTLDSSGQQILIDGFNSVTNHIDLMGGLLIGLILVSVFFLILSKAR